MLLGLDGHFDKFTVNPTAPLETPMSEAEKISTLVCPL